MIGEPPEWALWVIPRLLAFIMLLPIISSVSSHRAIILPQTRAAARRFGGGNACRAPAPVGSCRASRSAMTCSGKYYAR
jgi:hypothetical protein